LGFLPKFLLDLDALPCIGGKPIASRKPPVEVDLHLLEDQRGVILEKVRRSPLLAELCEANPHF
jgi:hypothetical protein